MLKFNKHRQREIPKAGRKINLFSHSRPDITYVVNVERILRYLKFTLGK